MSDSPAAVLVDVSGSLMAVTASLQVPSGATGLIFAGVGEDGTVRYPIIDPDGSLRVLTSSAPSLQQITGSVHVTNLPLEVTGNVGVGSPVDVTGSVRIDNQLTVASTGSLAVALVRNDITSSVTGTVIAVGPTASGLTPVTNPVLVAGYDGNNVQTLRTNIAGRQEIVLYDDSGNAASISNDAGVYRQEIAGKVSIISTSPPPATTPAVIFADTPLSVGTHNTTFVIPNGQTYYLQEIVAGNENPTRGASVEVFFYDGSMHLITRIYIAGTTLTVGYPDQSVARDGTALTGNGTNVIIVRRAKYKGGNIEIDAVVRGYTV